MKRHVFTVIAALSAALNISAAEPEIRLTAENIDEVVARMTLYEKAALLNGKLSESEFGWNFVANAEGYVVGAAGPTVDYPQYGIPAAIFADGPAGLRISPHRNNDPRSYFCTGFPVGTALASTWSTAAVFEACSAMGREVADYGVDALLGPGMNIQRNPLCGRNFEYFSEDPLLSGEIAAAYVSGVQSQGVGACIKHFAANNQETNRVGNDVIADERTLREIYLRPFERAVRKSAPWVVMTSYNKINGTFCCEDEPLLEQILRREWGYDGMVVTDWIERRNTAAEVHAGNDLLMPGSQEQIDDIVAAVNDGTLSIGDVDRNAGRILRYVTRTLSYKGHTAPDSTDLKAHAAVSRRVASEGIVMLKNNGALPLAPQSRTALYGLGSYALISGGTGSGHVNCPAVMQLDEGLSAQGFAVDAPLQKMYHAYRDYAWSKVHCESAWVVLNFGHPALAEMKLDSKAIVAREPSTDAAIVTIRRSSGETLDRRLADEYSLTDIELGMLREVCRVYHKAGKPVVVVLNIDGVIDVSAWCDMPDAILCAWLPGQEGGGAIADILSGAVNPSGRLPMTFASQYYDHASARNFPVIEQHIPQPFFGFREPVPATTAGKDIDYTRYEEGLYVGYRHFDKLDLEVAYPFGYGLSYTTFAYGKPKLSRQGDTLHITCEITNTGKVAGKEVVQLYAAAPSQSMDKPLKELRAFAKTRQLAPAEKETVEFDIPLEELASFCAESRQWLTEKGEYRLMVGASSRDIRQTVTVRLPERRYALER